MENDATRTGQLDEEQPFAAEQCRFDAGDALDVVVHRRLERHQTARIHPELLARCQIDRVQRPGGVEKGETVTLQLLQDEAFAAEEARADPAGEGDGDVDAARGAEEAVLLREHRTAPITQVERDDLAGERRREGDVGATRPAVAEQGNEERIAREHALAGPHQLVEQAATLRVRIEGGRHRDPLAHEHHAARLGEHRFAGVEGDDHGLQVIADDLVIDFISRHHLPPFGLDIFT